MKSEAQPNGSIAAAALSVGLGAFAFGVAVVASESSPAIAAKLNWYNPTGPLSGKTSVGIIVWLLAWAVLSTIWNRAELRLKPVLTTALVLISVGFILTFPPVFDAISGK